METFVGVALILVGAIWLLWSLYSLRKGGKSENWNRTTGIITKSVITDLSIQKGHGTCPIIHYEYSLDGRTYKSDRVTWGNVHSSCARSASAKVTDKYKEGKEVKVYYNPDNIAESVLEPGALQGTMLSLVVSCIPIIAGIIQLKTGFLKIG
jgi:hypothetical protein